MKSNFMMWVVVVLVLVSGYLLMRKSPATTTTPSATTSTLVAASPAAADAITVPLAEQSDLRQSGKAVFTTNADGKLVVTLALTGGTFTTPQPAHIHVGACPNPGAVKFPLASVVDGQSETVLDTTWAALVAAGEKLAVNVHKSVTETSVYTACGDLPITTATEADAMKPATTPAY